jgi:hypothetical protein
MLHYGGEIADPDEKWNRLIPNIRLDITQIHSESEEVHTICLFFCFSESCMGASRVSYFHGLN